MSVPGVNPAILGLNMVESSSIMDIPNGHVANQSVHIITSERNTTICIPQASSGKKCWFSKLLIKSVDHRVFLIVLMILPQTQTFVARKCPTGAGAFWTCQNSFKLRPLRPLQLQKRGTGVPWCQPCGSQSAAKT